MKNYEVTFIVDPVLSGEEIKSTAQTYVDLLKNKDCTIVHMNELGLRPLAYSVNKRHSGVYFCYEFQVPSGDVIAEVELALRRDERIMRFLTVKLDRYGIKYNDDKRQGRIGTIKKKVAPVERRDDRNDRRDDRRRDDRPRQPREEQGAVAAAPIENEGEIS